MHELFTLPTLCWQSGIALNFEQLDLSARELLAIKTVADYGSFNAAAITLNVSQPALTRTVQRVEKLLGLVLFERTTRSVEITDAGKEFVAFAERVLNDVRIYFDALKERSTEQRGQVVVSSVMSVAGTLLPPIVAKYKEIFPAVNLHVVEGVHGTVLENVRAGLADFGITYLDDIAPIFETQPLAKQFFQVLMHREHPLSKKNQISWNDLQNEPLVSLPSDSRTRRLIEATALTLGLQLKHAITVTQFATLMHFVAAGIGIAIIPEEAYSKSMRAAGLVALPLVRPKVSRVLGVIHLRERNHSNVAQTLITLVLAHCTKKSV